MKGMSEPKPVQTATAGFSAKVANCFGPTGFAMGDATDHKWMTI
jgi:hypothetical protein